MEEGGRRHGEEMEGREIDCEGGEKRGKGGEMKGRRNFEDKGEGKRKVWRGIEEGDET